MDKLKCVLAAIGGIAALALVVPAMGLADRPVANDHGTFTDGPYATDFCGVPGTQIDTGRFHMLQDASGGFVENENENSVFTAGATGKSLELSASDTVRVDLTDNGDGTASFTMKDSGLVLQFKIPNGPVLKDADGKPIRGAGILVSMGIVDLATGDILSISTYWKGPHPLRDGVDICGPAIAYLTS